MRKDAAPRLALACANSAVSPPPGTELAGVASGAGQAGATIVAVLDDAAHAAAAGCAIARAFPLYSAKKQSEEPTPIRVGYATREGPLNAGPYTQSDAAARAVRNSRHTNRRLLGGVPLEVSLEGPDALTR